VADVCRVGQNQLELTLQDVPHRLPINPGGFHCHVGTARLPRQSASSNSPAVVVVTRRTSWPTAPPSETLTHPTTVSLRTSNPAQRSWMTSITHSFTTLLAGSSR